MTIKGTENPESRDMRMVGEGEPGFPNCLLLLRINKSLEKVIDTHRNMFTT
jgi:hypothetical protein